MTMFGIIVLERLERNITITITLRAFLGKNLTFRNVRELTPVYHEESGDLFIVSLVHMVDTHAIDL